MERLSIEEKISEYLKMLNDGILEIANKDIGHYFSTGEPVAYFFNNYKRRLYKEVSKNPKYIEYDKAREKILNLFDKPDYIAEYIELVNSNQIPLLAIDKFNFFSNGKKIGEFYRVNKDSIIERLIKDKKYLKGYETIKGKIVGKLFDKINEYIILVNENKIEVKNNDSNSCFSNGDRINRYWRIHSKEIYDTIMNDKRYIFGYETAKEKIKEAYSKVKINTKISLKQKIDEYINMLNKDLISISLLDMYNKFSNGELINKFWTIYKEDIINALYTNKYKTGYEHAKELIFNYKESLDIIDEFIEKAEPVVDIIDTTDIVLSNGSKISFYLGNHRNKIAERLEKDNKYKKGYINLKRKLGLIIDDKDPEKIREDILDVMIEKLNNPKLNITKETKTNGNILKFFRLNKSQIAFKLKNDSKYKYGYEVIKTRIFGSSKIEEYIELLNNYVIDVLKFETNIHFKDGELISNFWTKNRKAIDEYLNSDERYIRGYEIARIKNELGCSAQSKSKETLKKSIICEQFLINYEYNRELLEKIPSVIFDALLEFYIKNKIHYLNFDGTLSNAFLITEKEFKEKYNMYFSELLNKKEKVNTL